MKFITVSAGLSFMLVFLLAVFGVIGNDFENPDTRYLMRYMAFCTGFILILLGLGQKK